MRIACTKCKTQFEIPDEKLVRGAVKVRCSNCENIFVVKKKIPLSETPEINPPPSEDKKEARFEDFDFQEARSNIDDFKFPDQEPAVGPFDNPLNETAGSDDSLSMGELDLGGFDGFDSDFSLDRDEEGPYEEQPLDRVAEDELISPRTREVEVQSLAENMPHLDIQRGPRRGESGRSSRMMARDGRRSPLFWIVLATAVSVGAFTVFNFIAHPEAFTFLNVNKISSLLQQRKIEAEFGVENLKGYYKDMPSHRQVFLIQGIITNKSKKPRGLIRVGANLFNSSGDNIQSREVYCGNELSDTELASLPVETIESRLQNQVGEGLSNVDIAPGAKVRFMVVFLPPPNDVAKFNVKVLSADG